MARYSDSIPNKSWMNVSEPVSWESFTEAPDTKKDTDWGSVFGKLFDIADKNKYRSLGDEKPSFDRGLGSSGNSGYSSGGAQRVTEDASVYTPPQMQPFTIAGTPGSSGGLFGDIGGAAGMLGTAFGVFGPLGAPIGAMAGKFIDRATS